MYDKNIQAIYDELSRIEKRIKTNACTPEQATRDLVGILNNVTYINGVNPPVFKDLLSQCRSAYKK